MMDLITRLSCASEGSEALDREIAEKCRVGWSSDEGGAFGGYDLMPRRVWFTQSFDAALSLLPPRFTWAAGDFDDDGFPWACVTDKANVSHYRTKGATTVLALVTAISIARGIK